MPPRFRAGFTLAEILSVFVLILVIAAILFPVYQHDQEGHKRRRRSSCASNMKQLGLSLTQYMQDSDEVLPSGVNAAGNGWAGSLYPFVKSVYAYRCPNDIEDNPYISYAENQSLVRQKLVTFSNPATTVAFYETTTLNCDPSLPETVSATGISAPQNSTRHENPQIPFGLNFAAVDGHVRYAAPGKVSGGPNAVPAQSISHGQYIETFAVK